MDISRPTFNLALIWRADTVQPSRLPERLQPLIEALAAEGVNAVHLPYRDDAAEASARRLAAFDGAIAWVNPIADGRDRARLDAVLHEAAASGLWVSAHPRTIAAMGTKAVLVATRELGWAGDTAAYASGRALVAGLAARLPGGARVLKPQRGNDGRDVVKVEAVGDGRLSVQAAADDRIERLAPDRLADRYAPLFAAGGVVVDQPYAARAAEGMVRCYLSEARVVGFGEQFPRAEGAFGMASAKAMSPPEEPRFAGLRRRMEEDWVPGLRRLLDLGVADLPAIWDADFFHGSAATDGAAAFTLCEINVSSVSPFPDFAAAAVAQTAARRLAQARAARTATV